jgi:hypothetical protein
MKSMIVQNNEDGTSRRCDAHCYNAKQPKCVCVCGGKNHGVGKQQAIKNTDQMAREIVRDIGDELCSQGAEV